MYDSTPIEWYVVDFDHNRNTATLVSQYAVDVVVYHRNKNSTPWGSCDLHNWLNGTFYNSAFSASDKGYIQSTLVSGSYDNVYILSYAELNRYLPYMGNTTLLTGRSLCYTKKTNTGTSIYVNSSGTSSWWIRTDTTGTHASFIGAGGKHYTQNNPPTSSDNGVRPVITVSLDLFR